MRKRLQMLAVVLAAASMAWWGLAGANAGWTKTQVPRSIPDPVTGLEAISGSASGITGTITFDPAHPGTATGKIVVSTASLSVPNGMMKEHMLGDKWLDAAKNPEITFEAKELKNVKTTGDTTTADVTGNFMLKGVCKELTVPVKFTYLKDKLAARTNGQMKGDLLVLRASFQINRSDFGIMSGQVADKVSEAIEITLSIAGSCPQ